MSGRRPGGLITKDPSSIEPQGFDWTLYLAELGADTIVTSTYVATPTGLTLSGASIVTGALKTRITLAGGIVGQRYVVTNHIVTSSGVEDDRSFVVLVQGK